jgi:hypothetical protein
MAISGFLIRAVSSTVNSNKKTDDIVYPTFDLACKHAQMKVDSNYEKAICLIRASTEQNCIENGHATLYSVKDKHNNESITIIAYALYSNRDQLST